MAAEESGKLDLKANLCVICQIPLDDSPISQLNCKHFLHDDCMQECARRRQTTCPICRKESAKLVQYAQILGGRRSSNNNSSTRSNRFHRNRLVRIFSPPSRGSDEEITTSDSENNNNNNMNNDNMNNNNSNNTNNNNTINNDSEQTRRRSLRIMQRLNQQQHPQQQATSQQRQYLFAGTQRSQPPPRLHFPVLQDDQRGNGATRIQNNGNILASAIFRQPNPALLLEETVEFECGGVPMPRQLFVDDAMIEMDGDNLISPEEPTAERIALRMDPELKEISTSAGGMHFMVTIKIPERLSSNTASRNGDGVNYRAPVDLIFILDRSGSMATRAGELSLAEMCERVVTHGLEQLTDQDRASIITFDNLIYKQSGLRRCTVQFKQSIMEQLKNNLKPGGSTAIHLALKEAFQMAIQRRQSHRQCHILLVTDGKNDTPIRMQDLAERVSSAGFIVQPHGSMVEDLGGAEDLTQCRALPNIHCFGLGPEHDIPCLQSISGFSGGIYQPIINAQLIGDAFGVVYGRIIALATGPMKLEVLVRPPANESVKLVRFRGDLTFQQLRDGAGALQLQQQQQLQCLLPAMAYGQEKTLIFSANIARDSGHRESKITVDCRLTIPLISNHPSPVSLQLLADCVLDRQPDRTEFNFNPQVVLQHFRLMKADQVGALMQSQPQLSSTSWVRQISRVFQHMRSAIMAHPSYVQHSSLFEDLLKELEQEEKCLTDQRNQAQSLAIVAANQTGHTRQTATVGATVTNSYQPSYYQATSMANFTAASTGLYR